MQAPRVQGTRLRDALALLGWLVLAAVASILLKQDSNWDLQNYHLYNVWAFVHGRHGIDWAPAQLQSFYSPYLDLPFHVLLAADLPPRVISALLALPTGIAWFFFALTLRQLFAPVEAPRRHRAIAAALVIGVTAPMALSLIGLTMNDWHVAALVMPAVFLLVRALAQGSVTHGTLMAASALVGLSAGLKLTGAIYGVGLLAGVLAVGGTLSARLRAVLLAGITMAAAFALSAGPWMWTLWQRFGNPLFPYFNDVFRSPWADPVSFSATAFGPASAAEWLVFPYMMLWKLQGYVSEPEFRDARPAVLYTLVLVALVLVVRRRLQHAGEGEQKGAEGSVQHSAKDFTQDHAFSESLVGSPRHAAAWRFVGVFFLGSFVAWALLYRIYRYLIPLELLGSALMVYWLLRLVPARRVAMALLATVALVLVTARFPTWWRVPFGEHFLAVRMPPVKAASLVLLVSDEPMSYVLPSFPADARFAGLHSNFNDPWRRNRLQQTIADTIRDHRGSLYSLAAPPGRDAGVKALAEVGLEREGCALLRTNLRASPLELCELHRTR